jgi:hypothetical protein
VKTSPRVKQRENPDFHIVRLTLFGNKASSLTLDLKNSDKDIFTSGKKDEFNVRLSLKTTLHLFIG